MTKTKQFCITGMSCAACSARIEKAVSAVDGVTSCEVSLLTNSMNVSGDSSDADIIAAVVNAGYGAESKTMRSDTSGKRTLTLTHDDIAKTLRRLIASLMFLFALMYVSMGYAMFGFPLPRFIGENSIANALVQLILCSIVMVINQKFFINGFKGAIHFAPNMDTLVALGSSAAFIQSTVSLFAMVNVAFEKNVFAAGNYAGSLYFESAAMILTLITVGKLLEAKAKGKTTDALQRLMKLAPQTAVIIQDGKEVTVPVTDVKKGDIFIVRPGQSIPVDGIIIDGNSSINESTLTGESIPVDKVPGDAIFSATINQAGFIRCEATHVGEDTMLSKIITMVTETAATKAPIARIADKVSGVFVPVVIAIALVTITVWLLLGTEFSFALARGISVLVISCPCALGLATPVAIMVGTGIGAKNGILFKTAQALEKTGRINTVVLDKTGTVTAGNPTVIDIVTVRGNSEGSLATYSERDFLRLAYSLEVKSEHPLAKAVVEKAAELNITANEVTDFEVIAGNGLKGYCNGKLLVGGSYNYISAIVNLPQTVIDLARKFTQEAKTPLLFAYGDNVIGLITVADAVKPDSGVAVAELRRMGVRTVLLTGDNENTACTVGKAVGIEEVIAGVLPNEKADIIKELCKKGKIAMVGDGINDAPALTSADVGIAVSSGTDIAIDAADIVLVKNSLIDVPCAIRLSRATLRNIRENLFWAFIYNIIGIPIAAGCLIPFGLMLTPSFGALAMSLSSFCVVTNALRLNFVNLKFQDKDRKRRNQNMKKVIHIEGMMCGHCEAHVKKSLEMLTDVACAVVNHKDGTAVVTLKSVVSNDVLKQTVEADGYTVTKIE